MTPLAAVSIALAAYWTTATLIDSVILEPVRDWVWRRWPYSIDGPEDDPAGRGRALVVPLVRRFKIAVLAPLAGLIWSKWAARLRRDPHHPGRTLIGYWWTCPHCAGTWVAAGWYLAWLRWPHGTVQWSIVPALAAVVMLLSAWSD